MCEHKRKNLTDKFWHWRRPGGRKERGPEQKAWSSCCIENRGDWFEALSAELKARTTKCDQLLFPEIKIILIYINCFCWVIDYQTWVSISSGNHYSIITWHLPINWARIHEQLDDKISTWALPLQVILIFMYSPCFGWFTWIVLFTWSLIGVFNRTLSIYVYMHSFMPWYIHPYSGICCVFQPSNGGFACRSLVKIIFLMLKQPFPLFYFIKCMFLHVFVWLSFFFILFR